MSENKEINKVSFLTPKMLRDTAATARKNKWDGVEIRFTIANMLKLADLLEQNEEAER